MHLLHPRTKYMKLTVWVTTISIISCGYFDFQLTFWWTGLLNMIIWMDLPFANDHLDWTTYCKWSSGSTSVLQMILLFLLCYSSPPQKNIFPLQIFSSFSSVNLLPCKKIFSGSKYIPHFSSSVLFSPEKIFSFIKYYLRFISPQ